MKSKETLLMEEKISLLRLKIKAGDYKFTLHSLERRIERSISKREIEETILTGEIIEDYPEDKYSPRCLIFGVTNQGRNIHVQCSIEPCMDYHLL